MGDGCWRTRACAGAGFPDTPQGVRQAPASWNDVGEIQALLMNDLGHSLSYLLLKVVESEESNA